MKKLDNPILLGKIGAPHGIHGQLRVTSFTANPLNLGKYGPLHTSDGRQFTITKIRPAKNVLIVSFKQINTREEAENARGLELFVERAILPENNDDEFYLEDLIGLHVKDTDGGLIGKILAVPNFGAGDLLEIAPANHNGFGKNTWYLAFTRKNVPAIDIKNGTITIIQPGEVSERDDDDI